MPNLHKRQLDVAFILRQCLRMDIIAYIKSRGMTVAGVARVAGVSRPSIYSLNDPNHSPEVTTLVAVARAIGVSPSAIRPELAE